MGVTRDLMGVLAPLVLPVSFLILAMRSLIAFAVGPSSFGLVAA
jgi:hypothetical protein